MANPTLLDMPIAVDGDKNTIPTTTTPTTGLLSQQYGWRDINSMPVTQGGKAPNRKDFNGVLNLLSNILFYCQKGWQFEWDSSQAYYAGCVVKDTSDGKMYQCLNDVTSTTAPHSDTTNWKIWDLSNYINNEDGIWQTRENVLFRDSNLYSLIIQAGNINDAGGQLLLGGKNNGTYKGGFYLTAQNDNDGDKTLEGHANGTLTCGGNDLAGSVITAKSLTANGYVKRASGELWQWGSESVTAGTSKTINYNLAFATSNYKTFITPVLGGGATYASAKITYEGGRYQFAVQSSEDCTINWFAIGW